MISYKKMKNRIILFSACMLLLLCINASFSMQTRSLVPFSSEQVYEISVYGNCQSRYYSCDTPDVGGKLYAGYKCYNLDDDYYTPAVERFNLRFELPVIPSGTVAGSSLTLFISGVTSPQQMSLYSVRGFWLQASCKAGGDICTLPYCPECKPAFDVQGSYIDSKNVASEGRISFDVTEQVRKALAAKETSLLFQIRGYEGVWNDMGQASCNIPYGWVTRDIEIHSLGATTPLLRLSYFGTDQGSKGLSLAGDVCGDCCKIGESECTVICSGGTRKISGSPAITDCHYDGQTLTIYRGSSKQENNCLNAQCSSAPTTASPTTISPTTFLPTTFPPTTTLPAPSCQDLCTNAGYIYWGCSNQAGPSCMFHAESSGDAQCSQLTGRSDSLCCCGNCGDLNCDASRSENSATCPKDCCPDGSSKSSNPNCNNPTTTQATGPTTTLASGGDICVNCCRPGDLGCTVVCQGGSSTIGGSPAITSCRYDGQTIYITRGSNTQQSGCVNGRCSGSVPTTLFPGPTTTLSPPTTLVPTGDICVNCCRPGDLGCTVVCQGGSSTISGSPAITSCRYDGRTIFITRGSNTQQSGCVNGRCSGSAPTTVFPSTLSPTSIQTTTLSPTTRNPTTSVASTTIASCSPPYDPAKWNNNQGALNCNNCYNYGCDKRTDNFAQPGYAHGFRVSMECSSVVSGARADGLAYLGVQDKACTGCTHKVALVVAPGNDFHWYRLDDNGLWSHKPGSKPVKNTDESGSLISSPETANRGKYTSFCGYFCVDKNSADIQGPKVCQF
jgi:hypothetical protein